MASFLVSYPSEDADFLIVHTLFLDCLLPCMACEYSSSVMEAIMLVMKSETIIPAPLLFFSSFSHLSLLQRLINVCDQNVRGG